MGDFGRVNLTWLLRHASDATPLTERPSFGGDDSVRGYRDDIAVGRSTVSLQNELLLPLDFLATSSVAAKSFFRRDTAFAIFADLGYLDGATGSVSDGFKASLGMGFRLAMGKKLQARLDWAKVLGADSYVSSGFGYLYFNAVVNTDF